MKAYRRSLVWVIALIVAVGSVTAYVGAKESNGAVAPLGAGPVVFQSHLVQDKVHRGSNGRVSVELSLSAEDIVKINNDAAKPVDLVLVLDRSGSMGGAKINDARQAVAQLIDRLTANDRLALVTYSNRVETVSSLVTMDARHRRQLKAAVAKISSGGDTNLGGGLQQGIDVLMETPGEGRQRRVVLISDGLANQGITDPVALGQMAARASEYHLAISTLGVGLDFNEILMTTIADHGAGRYYFLEDPAHFAQVFEQAFQQARHVAASDVKIQIPLDKEVRLVHAGGYPIAKEGHVAVVRPGDLMAGQQRSLFLTFQVPTDKLKSFNLNTMTMGYLNNGHRRQVGSGKQMTVACVSDPKAVAASINKKVWEDQVVQEGYGKLKEDVANAIRKGNKKEALARIQDYEIDNGKMNEHVQSSVVADNLGKDVQDLRQSVEETFVGPASAVAQKKKQSAKALQYDSYKTRRAKQ